MGIKITTNKKNPNITNSVSIDLVPRGRVFKTPRRKPPVGETGEAVLGYLGLIFIIIPIFLILVCAFPKFFGFLFGAGVLFWLVRKVFI